MPILTELIISIIGGVLTAAILSMFTRSGNSGTVISQQASLPPPTPRRRSFFVDLFVLILAVAGGIAIAMIGGRTLIQMGLLPRGLPSRMGLLVLGTVLCWMILSAGRRR